MLEYDAPPNAGQFWIDVAALVRKAHEAGIIEHSELSAYIHSETVKIIDVLQRGGSLEGLPVRKVPADTPILYDDHQAYAVARDVLHLDADAANVWIEKQKNDFAGYLRDLNPDDYLVLVR